MGHTALHRVNKMAQARRNHASNGKMLRGRVYKIKSTLA